MGRPRISPTPKELERFLADGLTHEQIVERVYEATGFGCNGQRSVLPSSELDWPSSRNMRTRSPGQSRLSTRGLPRQDAPLPSATSSG